MSSRSRPGPRRCWVTRRPASGTPRFRPTGLASRPSGGRPARPTSGPWTCREAVALSAGAVGESYRGGRLGQQAFVLDGLGVKNQLDASTGPLGVRIPPDILTEASLVTNGFSARYGQALSGLINVVTRDGGERWQGRAAYETDRPLWGAADMGLDRVVLSGDGPLLGGIRVAGALDAEARLDADPVTAP